MTRESVSRPTWSVPNSASASGGLFMWRKLVLSGSWGATQGAVMAITTMSRPMIPPAVDRVLRRAKATSSRRIERSPDAIAGSGIADTRVEQRVTQIDHEVYEDEDHRIEEDEVLNHDDVPLDQRRDKRSAEPGHPERLFHRHRSAQDEAEEHAGDGDDGQERIGQGVPQDNVSLLSALRTGGAHVVFADDLEQARARHACDVGPLGQAQHDGGADHDLEVLRGRLPEMHDDDGRLVAEPEEQPENDEHAQPEPRNGDEEDGQRAGHVVGQGIGPARAHNPHGEADEPGHEKREEADLGADRSAVEDELR